MIHHWLSELLYDYIKHVHVRKLACVNGWKNGTFLHSAQWSLNKRKKITHPTTSLTICYCNRPLTLPKLSWKQVCLNNAAKTSQDSELLPLVVQSESHEPSFVVFCHGGTKLHPLLSARFSRQKGGRSQNVLKERHYKSKNIAGKKLELEGLQTYNDGVANYSKAKQIYQKKNSLLLQCT